MKTTRSLNELTPTDIKFLILAVSYTIEHSHPPEVEKTTLPALLERLHALAHVDK